MSADEIRELTDLSTPIMPEHWQATVMWPEQWDKIKAALLAYAAMVERCEEMYNKFCMKFSVDTMGRTPEMQPL